MRLPRGTPVMACGFLLSTITTWAQSAMISPSDAELHDVVGRIIAEEAGSDTGCMVSRLDLDDDGADEVLFSFPVGAYGSQARVFRWEWGRERVLYEGGCDTPNAGFVLVDDTPTVVLEYSDYQPSYPEGKRMQRLHVWNGETFVYEPGLDCLLEQRTSQTDGATRLLNTADHCLPKRQPIGSVPCSTLRRDTAKASPSGS